MAWLAGPVRGIEEGRHMAQVQSGPVLRLVTEDEPRAEPITGESAMSEVYDLVTDRLRSIPRTDPDYAVVSSLQIAAHAYWRAHRSARATPQGPRATD
jgi:hypothetical protein